jgi:hypothetical protein
MSARFPAPCPSSKLITASHSWVGFAPFNFPGFKGTFSGQTFTGAPSDTGGSWSGGSVPTLNLGDLVLSQINTLYGGTGYYVYKLTTLLPSGWSAIDPQIDCVGSAFPFPNIVPGGAQFNGGASIAGHGGTGSYTLTGLIAGLTYGYNFGANDASVDGNTVSSGTFVPTGTSIVITCVNNGPFATAINVETSVQLAPATRHFTLWDYKVIGSIGSEEGPTDYPLIDTVTGSDYLNGYNREVWGAGVSGGAAYLQFEITNDFSGLAGASGAPGSDVITETWTVNKYTGAVTDSGPSPTPNSAEKMWMFPLPGHYDIGVYGDSIVPILISLSAGADSLVFAMGYTIGGTLYTFTQTLALSSEYDLSTAVTDCTALLDGTAGSQAEEFAALNWGQHAACSYNSAGGVIVTVTAMGSNTAPSGTVCIGSIPGGTTASAATGYGYNALTSGVDISMATAYIDVCGMYCLRTFHCTAATPVVDCASGTVDGYAPVTIPVPTLPSGETQVWEYLFPNCQCT